MISVGCDYHPGFQQIAFVDTDTGELRERRLQHPRNHDRSCDRRDAWVGLSSRPENDYERAFGWYGSSSTRAKWHALPSARTSTLEKCLTPPTLSERRFCTNCEHRAHFLQVVFIFTCLKLPSLTTGGSNAFSELICWPSDRSGVVHL
jgi:hypothetical protein